MRGITFEQAVRNAVEGEREAARFYTLLAESTSDDRAKRFLDEMADEERSHADRIDGFGREMTGGRIPSMADADPTLVETAPEWRFRDDITLEEAMQVALENELHAQLFYSALAEIDGNRFASFFSALAADEATHAHRLEAMLEEMCG